MRHGSLDSQGVRLNRYTLLMYPAELRQLDTSATNEIHTLALRFKQRCAMPADKKYQDAIYIEFGRFRAGATGRIAVTFFVIFATGAAITKLLGLW